jgi:hypothetical protein
MAGAPTEPITGRAAALIAAAEGHLEIEGNPRGPGGPWPFVASGLLVHATSCLRSVIFRLGPDGAHNDASRLLRILYDHVVTFAWLASDPPALLAIWRKADLQARLKMDREASVAGEQLLADHDREQMERDIAGIEGTVPDLASMAVKVDDYWAQRVEALRPDGLGSFRGLYTILFRQHSGLVHATMRGINHVSVDLDAPCVRIVMEDVPSEGNGPYGMATVVYGLGLLVAAEALGFPDAAGVEHIFDRFS